jgi:peptidyl-prolyl cis-trans isomerase D
LRDAARCAGPQGEAMFDLVHKHKRLIQVILGLIIVSFAFFGIETFKGLASNANEVAEVAGYSITQQEFQRAQQQQQDRFRQILGRNFDPAALDTAAARKELLDGIIGQRLLGTYAYKNNMVATDQQLRELIASVPNFQQDGKFSRALYESVLRAQGITPARYEQDLRGDLVLQQLTSGFVDSSFVAKTTARRFAELRGETREVAAAVVNGAAFASQVKVTPEALEAYYKANARAFEVPERVKVEYVELSRDGLAAQEPVTAEEVKAYYEANIAPQFKVRAEARGKAEALTARVKKDPAQFEALAKAESQDPGSAGNGGDLGWFARGSMVKPFEDAVFRQKEGEIGGPVESEFGFHIVRVTGVRKNEKGTEERRASHILITAPQGGKSFEAARPEIEKELRDQRIAKRFPEATDTLSNLVYEQSESLQPAADRFKVALRKTEFFSRADAPPPFNNARVQAAVFSDDAIRNRRNTEVFEVAPGRVVAARVIDHKAATVRPFEEVKAQVQQMVQENEAVVAAKKSGMERLAALQAGQDAKVAWSAPKSVTRENPAGIDPPALGPIFRVDPAKLPAYVGIDLPGGYGLYRVSRVTVPGNVDPNQLKAAEFGLSRQDAREDYEAFVQGLRARNKVKINETALAGRGS